VDYAAQLRQRYLLGKSASVIHGIGSTFTSTGRIFLLPIPDGALVDRRSFQSDVILQYGRDYWRPELSGPSLLEASLNVKRNSAHGWGSLAPPFGSVSFCNHLNCGTVGTVMRGGGIGATLEAFPIPLGSDDILPRALSSAAFGRPAPGCPIAAEPPPPRANEAAEVAKTRNNAMANFVVVFDMGSSVHIAPQREVGT
jgi:hypothetical protein